MQAFMNLLFDKFFLYKQKSFKLRELWFYKDVSDGEMEIFRRFWDHYTLALK